MRLWRSSSVAEAGDVAVVTGRLMLMVGSPSAPAGEPYSLEGAVEENGLLLLVPKVSVVAVMCVSAVSVEEDSLGVAAM
jgi:hypothetical protein